MNRARQDSTTLYFFPMRIFLATFLILNLVTQLFSQAKPVCISQSDCLTKLNATTIHRKRIGYVQELLTSFKKNLTEEEIAHLRLEMLKSIVLEARGETGYQGEIILKVKHKESYVQTQMQKAKEIILDLRRDSSLLSKADQNELNQLETLLLP